MIVGNRQLAYIERTIRKAIECGQRIRLVIKNGDMPHTAFYLLALEEIGFVALDDLSRQNISYIINVFCRKYPEKRRTFIMNFIVTVSSLSETESVVVELARATKRVNLLSSGG